MHRRADHGLGHRPLTVAGLWRYPVKSMVGEQVSRIDIDMSGVVGDRGYAVADAVTGKMLTAKREPRLLSAMAKQ